MANHSRDDAKSVRGSGIFFTQHTKANTCRRVGKMQDGDQGSSNRNSTSAAAGSILVAIKEHSNMVAEGWRGA